MHVVLGASGNTGHVVAKNLLEGGKKVRVVGRNAAHLQFLEAEGAEIFVADVTDASALTQAFHEAESAYVMIPPNHTSNDFRAYQETASTAIATALQKAGLANVVSLSSFGADKASGTGPVAGLHNLEEKLNRIDRANVLHLRAGYFMENTLAQAAAIRMMGFAAGPISSDLKLPMIATCDIGKAAADALLRLDFRGKQTHELHGQRDLDYTEATTIIGKAIGKPDLKYIQAPDDQVRAAMVQMGNVRQFRRTNPRNGRRTQRWTHAAPRSSGLRQHNCDDVRRLRRQAFRPRLSTTSGSLTEWGERSCPLPLMD